MNYFLKLLTHNISLGLFSNLVKIYGHLLIGIADFRRISMTLI